MIIGRKAIWFIIFFTGLFPVAGFTQANRDVTGFWRPVSLSSALTLGGQYRYQEGYTNEVYNYQKNPRFYGGILLNSNSYFWHPNFVVMDLGLEYNPMKNQADYLVVPDQSEISTVKRIDINTTFFKHKPVTFSIFANANECYTNRENLSNLKLNSANWGGNLALSNKVLPLQVSYNDGTWKENEINTGRMFNMRQKNLQASIIKSFSSLDRNEFRYSHNYYYRQDDNLAPISNIADNFDLLNRIDFNKNRDHTFNSHISGIKQTGYDEFSRFQANESITLKLPANFTLSGNYDYYNNERISQKSVQNNLSATLGYRLFKSLTASVYFEDNSLKHTLYQETNYKVGMDVRYTKTIPTGYFSLGYASFVQRQKRVSGIMVLQVFNESHILTDGQIILLNKAYVYLNTVVVKDITGTIIYQQNFDYILIERNNLVEIQRIPGGQIANGGSVYVDYSFIPPGSYQFNANFKQFTAEVVLFKNLLQVYFRLAKQDYDNIIAREALTLNYFTQTIYGGRLDYKFVSGGVEYELYSSTIIPYRQLRYFLTLQGNIKNKISYSISGNVRNYYMLDDKTNQDYIDLTGVINYAISPQTKLNVEFGYRKQVGHGIDLDLLTGKADISTIYRKLHCKVGLQVYKRMYLYEKTNFIGGYVEIVRNFNWHRK
jgi:hypothetical protein